MRIRWIGGGLLAITAGAAIAPAQRAVQFDVVYSCSSGRTKLKVVSCAGNSDTDSCDIQYLDSTSPQGLGARIAAPRKQVADMLQTCVIVRPPAKTDPPAAPAARAPRQTPATAPRQQPAAPAPRPAAPNISYKIGDHVQIIMAGRWVDGQIVANGVSDGDWRVAFPDGRAIWTTSASLRPMPAAKPSAPAPAAKLAGAPCGSRIEGRWSNSLGTASVEFRGGKAHVNSFGTEVADCTISGDKIFLRLPGDAEVMTWRLNDDNTIDAPIMGELRKKGK